jgi:hypothetical protein
VITGEPKVYADHPLVKHPKCVVIPHRARPTTTRATPWPTCVLATLLLALRASRSSQRSRSRRPRAQRVGGAVARRGETRRGVQYESLGTLIGTNACCDHTVGAARRQLHPLTVQATRSLYAPGRPKVLTAQPRVRLATSGWGTSPRPTSRGTRSSSPSS